MRGVRGIADQDDLAVTPLLAADPPEVEPRRRALQMRGVAEQWLAAEIAGEDRLAPFDDCGLVHRVEAKSSPGLGRTFDDEGRAIVGKAIGVGPDPPRLGLLEGEGEGIETSRRAEPDELVGALIDLDPERIGAKIAHPAVDSVGRDHEVIVAPGCRVGVALVIVIDCDPKLFGAGRKQVEQLLAADTDEPMPRRAVAFAADVDVDVVPMCEPVTDARRGYRVIGLQIVDRLVGKDDAPAEGHAARIAFEHANLMPRVAQFHRDGEIETRRSRTDAGNLHLTGVALRGASTQSPAEQSFETAPGSDWFGREFAVRDSSGRFRKLE